MNKTRSNEPVPVDVETSKDKATRKRRPKQERLSSLDVVERHIRESNHAPGFDYPNAILNLRNREGYADEDIAAACEVAKSAVGHWLRGRIPRHDHGERLFILYFETFKERPPTKMPK